MDSTSTFRLNSPLRIPRWIKALKKRRNLSYISRNMTPMRSRICEEAEAAQNSNVSGKSSPTSSARAKAACVALSEAGVKWAVVTQGEGGAWACDEKGRLFHRAAEAVVQWEAAGLPRAQASRANGQ